MYNVMQADILQEKLETYLMADKIRWLHFGTSGRPVFAWLCVTLLAGGGVAAFQVLGRQGDDTEDRALL